MDSTNSGHVAAVNKAKQNGYDYHRFPALSSTMHDAAELDSSEVSSEVFAENDSPQIVHEVTPRHEHNNNDERKGNSFDDEGTSSLDIHNFNIHINSNTPPLVVAPTGLAIMRHQTPPKNSFTKGTVYSAIGSLEDASANSIGAIKSQYKQSMWNRDFKRPTNSTGHLIPPSGKSRSKSNVPPAEEAKSIDSTGQNVATKTHSSRSANAPVDDSIAKQQSQDQIRSRETKKLRRKPKKVVIQDSRQQQQQQQQPPQQPKGKKKKPVEVFRKSCDAYTPRTSKVLKSKYKPAEKRIEATNNMGTLARPNFRDALRRVAMIIHQHVVKIGQRFEHHNDNFSSTSRKADQLFRPAMMEAFSEENFATPTYKCTMVRLPMARPGMVYGLRKVQRKFMIPSEEEIYEFGHQLFDSVQLSSECSIVCLIYVERLMEHANVPLVASTWKPIFMCGLLLASKVWQDLSSWNIEFASVYPQFSVDAINRLELLFLKMIKWDLYISSMLYAKYYFALRSLLEKQDFRNRYNRMVGGVRSVDASEALKVQQRSEQVKEEALQSFSRSM